MSCPSDSTITIRLDNAERFVSFTYRRAFCGQIIAEKSDYCQFCAGKTLPEIFRLDFADVINVIPAASEEDRFLLFSEWEALRCAIGQYLGTDDQDVDVARCQTVAVKHEPEGMEITQFILPPNRLPDEKDREMIFKSARS